MIEDTEKSVWVPRMSTRFRYSKGSTDADVECAPSVAQEHIVWLADDFENGKRPEGVVGRFRRRGRTLLVCSLHVSILYERVMKPINT